MVSPMLSCEDAWHLGQLALAIDPNALVGVGPIPFDGEDKTFPGGYTIRAEKAPNARGVRRVLEALGIQVLDAAAMESTLSSDASIDRLIVTGNYPSEWVTPSLSAVYWTGPFRVIDRYASQCTDHTSGCLPASGHLG